jgi:hypothetical protein
VLLEFALAAAMGGARAPAGPLAVEMKDEIFF